MSVKVRRRQASSGGCDLSCSRPAATPTEIAAAVESNRDIGAAVGILMCRRHLTQEQAFETLRQVSQHHHIKLRVLARDVIHTGTLDLPVPPPANSSRAARPRPAPPLQLPREHRPR